MDSARVVMLREALARTGWVERTRDFAGSLRRVSDPGRLLLVGTPDEEPWHLAAHLDDEARISGLPQLSPTLVRWSAPPQAPPHLAVTMQRLEAASRNETVFVVAPDAAPESLLERVADARRIGATILSIDDGDDELGSLVHDRLVVSSSSNERLVVASDMPMTVDIDTVQHLVSVAAGENLTRSSMRDRIARMLERVSGPAPRA
ncbi:MAG TPA: hypothetical protein VFV76_01065 [Actinomycetes bacterium]|nr:hypothetical protein [Actinomycetes bacterium]